MFETEIFYLWFPLSVYVLGRMIFSYLSLRQQNHVMMQNMIRHIDHVVHRVDVAKQADMIYWYDLDDGEFLAQGRSNQEVIDTLKARFPDHFFFVTADSREVVISAQSNWQPLDFSLVAGKIQIKV